MRDVHPKVSIRQLLQQQEDLVSLFSVRKLFPGAEVYLVGGAVRDAILGRPCKDFDFVIRGVPEEQLIVWMQSCGTVDFVGRVFGVYKFVPTGSNLEIDIALPRTERANAGSQGSYRAFTIETNAFLPIIEDLARRDLTINAMAFEINTDILYDPFSGLKDLEGKMIRAVGGPQHRFEEDLSRILRAVRFACELRFAIEDRTWEALKRLAPRIEDRLDATAMRDRLRGRPGDFVVPRETVGRELIKSLAADFIKTRTLWRESGLFQAIDPALHVAVLSDLDGRGHSAPTANRVHLALLLAPIGKIGALRFYEQFVLSEIGNADARFVSREDLGAFLEVYERLHRGEDPVAWPASDFADVFLASFSEDLLIFLECMSVGCEEIRDRRSHMRGVIETDIAEDVPPLVNGSEVMRLTGIVAGPALGRVIKKLRDAQLNGEIKTAEEATALLIGSSLLEDANHMIERK